MEVTLINHSNDPITSLYVAYRTCYSADTPQKTLARIENGSISREKMERFVVDKLELGHVSPLEQVWFQFALNGISRACSHQLVRHRVGWSYEQQSQRYVSYAKASKLPTVMPQSIVNAGKADEVLALFAKTARVYASLVEAGVPNEDARFVLPNATTTNLVVGVNFAALQHFCDLRLCTRAQWEIRKLASLMRREVNIRWPILGAHLGPKCMASRAGSCDESFDAWRTCQIGLKRPWRNGQQQGPAVPLDDVDMRLIASLGSEPSRSSEAV